MTHPDEMNDYPKGTAPHANVSRCPQVEQTSDEPRPFVDLMEATGLLWLINRQVFHPRGLALALVFDDDERQQPVGWQLVGDGTTVWTYSPDEAAHEAERFEAAMRTFDEPRVRAYERAENELADTIAKAVELGFVEVVTEGDER